ncbi:hypothetical protein LTR10_003240 [Elasticomyces elasticus]|nr:hypothetical protein LTR10_003240 [Elasticomyces elasticus]KAK4969511.1 hypothetical protein LTR42_008782 [Elasticomyces elasticus]
MVPLRLLQYARRASHTIESIDDKYTFAAYRAILADGERPYICNLCHQRFHSLDSVFFHYYGIKEDQRSSWRQHWQDNSLVGGCWEAHGKPAGTSWCDHPSCLSTWSARNNWQHFRPFYPEHVVLCSDSARVECVWPPGVGWPVDLTDLLAQNERYRRWPDANPWFVSKLPYTAEQRARDERLGYFATPTNVISTASATRRNVQVAHHGEPTPTIPQGFVPTMPEQDEDISQESRLTLLDGDCCLGEDPEVQLLCLLDVVTPETFASLKSTSKTQEGRKSAMVDDILLGVALHTSDQLLADYLGLAPEEVKGWLEQATHDFAAVHFLDEHGEPHPNPRALIETFRQRHVEQTSGKCLHLACCQGGKIIRIAEKTAGQQ